MKLLAADDREKALSKCWQRDDVGDGNDDGHEDDDDEGCSLDYPDNVYYYYY